MTDTFRTKAFDILAPMFLAQGYAFQANWTSEHHLNNTIFFSKVIDGSLTIVCAVYYALTYTDSMEMRGYFEIEIGRDRKEGLDALLFAYSNEALRGFIPIPPASPIPLISRGVLGHQWTWRFRTEEELSRLLIAVQIRLESVVLPWVEALTTAFYTFEPKKEWYKEPFRKFVRGEWDVETTYNALQVYSMAPYFSSFIIEDHPKPERLLIKKIIAILVELNGNRYGQGFFKKGCEVTGLPRSYLKNGILSPEKRERRQEWI